MHRDTDTHLPGGRSIRQEQRRKCRRWIRQPDRQLDVSGEVSRRTRPAGRPDDRTDRVLRGGNQPRTGDGRPDRLTSPRSPGCCVSAPGLQRSTTRRTPPSDAERYRKHIWASPPPARFCSLFPNVENSVWFRQAKDERLCEQTPPPPPLLLNHPHTRAHARSRSQADAQARGNSTADTDVIPPL